MTQQGTPGGRALNAGLVVSLIALLLLAAAGCGTKARESASAGKARSGSSKNFVSKIVAWKNATWKKLTAKKPAPKSMASNDATPESATPQSTEWKSTAPASPEPRSTTSKSTASKRRESKSARSRVAAHHAGKGRAKSAATASASQSIRLIQKGCIQFDPPWTTIRVGQRLTWRSRLKRQVTIHVSAGAFDRTAYVVSAGGSVSTGPAREPGSYSMWSRPASCQGTPSGVHGTGPGVTVARGSG